MGANIVKQLWHVRDLNQANHKLGGPKILSFYHSTFDLIENQEVMGMLGMIDLAWGEGG